MTNSTAPTQPKISYTVAEFDLFWFAAPPRRFLNHRYATTIIDAINDRAFNLDIGILHYRCASDRVELKISAPPNLSLNQIAHALKDTSAKALKEKHPELKRRDAIWETPYYAESLKIDMVKELEDFMQEKDADWDPLPD